MSGGIADTHFFWNLTTHKKQKNNKGFNYQTCGFSCQKSGYPAPKNWKITKHVDSQKKVYPLNLTTKKLVPAPIATLRNLNIVQNGKSSFKGFKFVGIFRRASLFPFWAIGIVVFRTLYFGKKQEPNFLTRDILFEMKLTLSVNVK